MADGRRNNGGHSTKGKAGRKPKAAELKIIETIDKALKASNTTMAQIWDVIIKEAKQGSKPHLDMVLNYYYGKPKEIKDINLDGAIIAIVDDTE